MTTRTFANRITGAIATLSVAAALAACGSTAAESPSSDSTGGAGTAPATPTHNQADVTFVQDMIPHHEQAVAMSKLAADRAGSAQVKDLAGRIEAAQQPEIDQMDGLLKTWNVAMSTSNQPPMSEMNSGGMGGMGQMDHSTMPGMMSSTQMDQLGRSSGTAFDAMFLQMMIGHHQGAVTMSQTELASGQSPEAKALGQRIIDAQQREITEMRGMLPR